MGMTRTEIRRVNGEVCVEYLAILPLTNYGQAIATLSRPSYPLPQGER
jgi:hypothetical protein